MRKLDVIAISLILCCPSLWGKSATQETPQTARQALLEMFFSKTPGTFMKHLPAITRTTLEKSGALANLQQYSLLAGQMQAQGKNFQTFETGSILLSTEDPKTGQKVEAIVENDALQGDQDDIELSFVTYKDGQPQRTPFMPRTTFSMKIESGIWKLYEISLTVHLPLADPDLLKNISENMKARAAAGTSQIQSQSQIEAPTPTRTFGSDANILAAMRTILTAEVTYATTYRGVGYTCTLSDLDGFGGGEANEHQAMLINSGLASGKRYGYVFTLSSCSGAPAASFHLTAAPNGESYGRRVFCTDQSGVIRSSSDGNAATCLSSGTPAQ
jgi:hypothetical protein